MKRYEIDKQIYQPIKEEGSANMVESTIRPQAIEIDTIKNGKVRLLAHWDIEQTERIDEMTERIDEMTEGPQIMWTYDEQVIKDWVLPYNMTSRAAVEAYFASIEAEILDWAKGAKVTIR